MRFQTRRWDELTRDQQRWVVGLGSVEVVLTAASLIDLARRPVDQVRGSKALWALAMLVQPAGPIAYLTVGRRPGEPAPAAPGARTFCRRAMRAAPVASFRSGKAVRPCRRRLGRTRLEV